MKRNAADRPSTGTSLKTVPADPELVVEEVRERYRQIAAGETSGCSSTPDTEQPGSRADAACGASAEAAVALGIGYGAQELAALPEGANLGLGCGAPLAFLNLTAGETVLDLGSGPGLDAFLAARQVGPEGRVIGVDMTPAMIERARAGAAEVGLRNVEFREGRMEHLPVEDASVDAATSNCVINLVPDKAAVFREMARVLHPGGRLVISDIVLDGHLPGVIERNLLAYVGCVAGATQRDAYLALFTDAGLTCVDVLRDVDYLAASGTCLPHELQEQMRRAGITAGDLAGVVRSVTIRAFKPGRS